LVTIAHNAQRSVAVVETGLYNYSKSYERVLMKFLEGWSMAEGTNDYILVVIRITLRGFSISARIQTRNFLNDSLFTTVIPIDSQE